MQHIVHDDFTGDEARRASLPSILGALSPSIRG